MNKYTSWLLGYTFVILCKLGDHVWCLHDGIQLPTDHFSDHFLLWCQPSSLPFNALPYINFMQPEMHCSPPRTKQGSHSDPSEMKHRSQFPA